MRLMLVLCLCGFLAACATQKVPQDQSAFVRAAPRSILIVPIENKSLEIDAANYMLSTLTVPLAEKGYYVFPVNTVKVVLERDGLYEPEKVRQVDPQKLASYFGADAILYVGINRWDAQYAVLATSVTVDLTYRLVSKSGEELWRARKTMQYTPQTSNAGHPLATLVAAAVQAAITKALPDYMPLARQANTAVFETDVTAWPQGPYAVKAK
jgi:hypothetical protein